MCNSMDFGSWDQMKSTLKRQWGEKEENYLQEQADFQGQNYLLHKYNTENN